MVISSLTVTNSGASDAAYVCYLEPTFGPSSRYYLTTSAGDTLLRPNPDNGSVTHFDISVKNLPFKVYREVVFYHGSQRLVAGTKSPDSVNWVIRVSGDTYKFCQECQRVPKP